MITDPGNKKNPGSFIKWRLPGLYFYEIRNSFYYLNNFFSLIIAVAVSGNIFSHPDSPSAII